MTRKDYVKFAEMLKAQQHTPGKDRLQISRIIHATVDIFAADNPNFDRDRFLTACGVES